MVDCPYNVHYKAYQSLEPCTSIYLKQKWDKAGYEKYVQRILLAKYVVDDSPPFSYQHSTQLKNKENINKNSNKKQVIYLNQYDYNMKKAVEEQYKKDQLNKMNENLLQKLKYMARESEYGRDKLLKENKEHNRLLKSISRYPPPHTQNTQRKNMKTTTNKKTTSKIMTTNTTTKNVKVMRKKTSSAKKEIPIKKVTKPKEKYDYSTNSMKHTKKEVKKDKSKKGKSSTNTKKNKKHKSKTKSISISSSSSNSSSSSSSTYSSSNSNNHSRNNSCDSSSSLISNDSQFHNESINNKDEIILLNDNPEYSTIKEKFDHLYNFPSKSSLPLFFGSKDGLNDKNSENIKSVKKKVLEKTELIQNRQSLKEYDFTHLDT